MSITNTDPDTDPILIQLRLEEDEKLKSYLLNEWVVLVQREWSGQPKVQWLDWYSAELKKRHAIILAEKTTKEKNRDKIAKIELEIAKLMAIIKKFDSELQEVRMNGGEVNHLVLSARRMHEEELDSLQRDVSHYQNETS